MGHVSDRLDLDQLDDVEQTVRAHLDRLNRLDEISPRDVEAFRQALPTEPLLSELVDRALPFPWSEVFEYVQGSDRQRAYWRVKPDRYEPRSEADRANRVRFAQAARETRGLQGTSDRNGRRVPTSAAHVGDAVADEGRSGEDESGSGRRAIRRLREVLGR